jgi:hypothetical protein
VLYYLSLTACYLKSKEEAEVFKNHWDKIKDSIKSGSDKMDYLNQAHILEKHIEQALAEEDVHNPKSLENIGIATFYENNFSKLYENARLEYTKFQEGQDKMVKGMQSHHEEVFKTQESWEAALRRGDPMALVD